MVSTSLTPGTGRKPSGIPGHLMFDLSGRIALVTGAGQNVGAGIALALAGQGARVIVNDFHPDRAEDVAQRIEASGGSAEPLPFDVTDLSAVRGALQSGAPIDILVNNAGNAGAEQMRPMPFVEMGPEAWEAPVSVNLYGVLHCCHILVPTMCERGWGRIVTISSGAATAGTNIGVSAYSAGKGGGLAFTRSLALEVAKSGVTANTVAIGLMANPDADAECLRSRWCRGRGPHSPGFAPTFTWSAAHHRARAHGWRAPSTDPDSRNSDPCVRASNRTARRWLPPSPP
jgi:NAD(P)-dependent dehydrogenase (short-subunit alcohol dehydrogenase family)